MRYYLAGPMSGMPEYNYPAFDEIAAGLRARNLEVVSPHELHEGELGYPWEYYIKADLRAMLECGALVLLPGWRKSRGARLECNVADNVKMFIFEVYDGHKLKLTRMGNQDVTKLP